MKVEDHPAFYIRHAARMIGVSAKTVRRWCNDGKIPYTRNPINNWRYFTLGDINSGRRILGRPPLDVNEAIEIYNKMREEE